MSQLRQFLQHLLETINSGVKASAAAGTGTLGRVRGPPTGAEANQRPNGGRDSAADEKPGSSGSPAGLKLIVWRPRAVRGGAGRHGRL